MTNDRDNLSLNLNMCDMCACNSSMYMVYETLLISIDL